MKTRTNKSIVSLLLICVLLALHAVPAAAFHSGGETRDPVTFTVSSVETEPDTDVTVQLSISGSYSANALTLFLRYDSSLLQVVGKLSKGAVWYDMLDAEAQVVSTTANAGEIGLMAIAPTEDFTSEGVLFSVTFHVSAEAGPDPIPLMLEVTQFTHDELDGTVNPISFISVNGVITVIMPEPQGLMGDVNDDGVVDFDDVTLLNAYLLNAAELTEEGLANANVNGDSRISSADVVALNKLILGSN